MSPDAVLDNLWPRWLEAAQKPPFHLSRPMPNIWVSFICPTAHARHETHMPHCFRAMAKGSSTYTRIESRGLHMQGLLLEGLD